MAWTGWGEIGFLKILLAAFSMNYCIFVNGGTIIG
jgi:hypothetical protein